MRSFALVAALSAVVAASAKQIVITVGANTTANASTIFSPAEVTAVIGDTVLFNFTQGNHSATQSTFASPCIPAHDTNSTINGFNSGLRPTNNGTAITNLPVTITTNDTIWFYDIATCALGGVGGINVNESSTETLDGFIRNAIRLNGTATSTSASASATAPSGTGSSTRSSSTASATGGSNGADRAVVGALAALPMALIALVL
ncbi:uncharacterized protein TRAVEDRAFT_31350 [Trametes versicolor FP-101664 SS1]|uniref:uncharacterized protein n=1 Tax=Trametes versicolor (strain FP-101664) TaxID=717944 RepID=UPI0004622D94|nr:uncharacterized protein TRAVEDRAFT_31350 [Trametes versicolor FP-101664 SS1]EIW54396.1 hypothetical protein TRAVEDRAFT_31350 [Trametes versicolor FP-101664 SS1]